MSPHATVTVELAEENLLALLGQTADKAVPPPKMDAAPSLPPPLPEPAVAEVAPLLQSAKRPLFAPPSEPTAVTTAPNPTSSNTSLNNDSWEPAHPQPAEPQSAEMQTGEAASIGLVLYQAPAPTRRPMWVAAGGIALVVAGFAVYATYAARHPEALAVISPGAESAALAKYSPLKLQLESRERSLVAIRWDPQSAPVGRANSGRLVILETGSEPRVVPLDATQLKIGHLYYETPSDRVEFRLEVVDGTGAVTSESLLALALPPATATTASETAVSATQMAKPSAVPARNTPDPASAPKPSAREFAPPAAGNAEPVRAVYLEPPPENVNPRLSVLASLPETFNHFAPPATASVPSNVDTKSAMSKPDTKSDSAARLLHRVAPIYPANARAARIEGTVRFTATITKDGKVKNLQPLSGDPLLIPAAGEAAKQWLYQPTMMNGRPVDAVTQITVDFTLN